MESTTSISSGKQLKDLKPGVIYSTMSYHLFQYYVDQAILIRSPKNPNEIFYMELYDFGGNIYFNEEGDEMEDNMIARLSVTDDSISLDDIIGKINSDEMYERYTRGETDSVFSLYHERITPWQLLRKIQNDEFESWS